jgi:hypothetical protein
MIRTGLLLALLPLVTACASSVDRWSQPDKVLFSDVNTIRIQWRPWQITEQAVRGRAVLHCNGRPMEEVEAERSSSSLVRAKTWKCLGL